jgi:hypothetical protein
LAASLAVLATGSAGADQVYFDRPEFVAAITHPVSLDFEEESVGPVWGDPWFDLGIVFDQAGVGDNMAIGDGDGYDMNIYAAGGPNADIDVSFPVHGTLACGIAVYSNNVHDPSERLVFLGEGDVVLADVEMPLASFVAEFVGYVADVTIVRVAFIEANDDEDWAGIGEVIFQEWGTTPVVPGSWARIKRMYSD